MKASWAGVRSWNGFVAPWPGVPQRTRGHPQIIPRGLREAQARTRQEVQQGLWTLPQEIHVTEYGPWRRKLAWRERCKERLPRWEGLGEQEALGNEKAALPFSIFLPLDKCWVEQIDGGGCGIYMQLLNVIMIWAKSSLGGKNVKLGTRKAWVLVAAWPWANHFPFWVSVSSFVNRAAKFSKFLLFHGIGFDMRGWKYMTMFAWKAICDFTLD